MCRPSRWSSREMEPMDRPSSPLITGARVLSPNARAGRQPSRNTTSYAMMVSLSHPIHLATRTLDSAGARTSSESSGVARDESQLVLLFVVAKKSHGITHFRYVTWRRELATLRLRLTLNTKLMICMRQIRRREQTNTQTQNGRFIGSDCCVRTSGRRRWYSAHVRPRHAHC